VGATGLADVNGLLLPQAVRSSPRQTAAGRHPNSWRITQGLVSIIGMKVDSDCLDPGLRGGIESGTEARGNAPFDSREDL